MGLFHPSQPGTCQTRLHSQTPWILRPDISPVQLSFPRFLPAVKVWCETTHIRKSSPMYIPVPLSRTFLRRLPRTQLLHGLEYFPVKGAHRSIKIFFQGPDPMIDSVSVFECIIPFIYLVYIRFISAYLLVSFASACFLARSPSLFPCSLYIIFLRLSDCLSRNRRIDDDLPDPLYCPVSVLQSAAQTDILPL